MTKPTRSEFRAVGTATMIALATPAPGITQEASVWLDMNAVHSRPPTGTEVATTSYGLLGLRLRLDGRRSAFDLGLTTGRGTENGGGGWVSGRVAGGVSGISHALDFGLRVEGTGLTYFTPVRIGSGDEFSQWLAVGALRPYAGLTFGRLHVGLEGTAAGGGWGSEVTTTPTAPITPPLPPIGGDPTRSGAQRTTVNDNGTVVVAGGAATLTRAFGPVILNLRGGSYHAENQAGRGRYTGADGVMVIALGSVDLSLGAQRWTSPAQGTEFGAHAGIGVTLAPGAYLRAVASRSVSDPFYGSAGDLNLSAGISVRLGRTALGPPPSVRIVRPTTNGQVVRFTLKLPEATHVAVAGDFTGWEPRALKRGTNGVWSLETVLAPGVYHYSFVIDGRTWLVPDGTPGMVDDGFGRKNGTVIVNASRTG